MIGEPVVPLVGMVEGMNHALVYERDLNGEGLPTMPLDLRRDGSAVVSFRIDFERFDLEVVELV